MTESGEKEGGALRNAPHLASAAWALVRESRRGMLATLMKGSGFPYGSLVDLLPREDGDVVLFFSSLAEHQHYLSRDPRTSVLIAPYLFEENALAKPRVTLVGRTEPEPDRSALIQPYLAAHPAAGHYIELPDFKFYRLQVEKVRYIAGFGEMGWIDGADYRLAALA